MKTNLLVAFLVASVAGVFSVLMIQFPERVGVASVLLLPGAILGIATSENVHDFPTWAVVAGNFAFYFGAVYLACEIWVRHTRKADAGKED